MPARYSRYIPLLSLLGDFVLLNFLFVAGFCLLIETGRCFDPENMLFYIYLNLVWLVLVISFGAHYVRRNTGKKLILLTYIRIIVFFFFFFLMYFQLTPLEYYPRSYIKYLFPLFFFLLMVWKFGLYYGFLLYRKWGFNFRNVVIVGYSAKTIELARFFMNNKWHGYKFLGFFDETANSEKQILGPWTYLPDYCKKNHVDEIYMALDQVPEGFMSLISDVAATHTAKLRIVPDLGKFSYKSTELIQYGNTPVIKIHRGPLSYWYNSLIKRIFDVVVSLFVIVVILSWMIPVLFIYSLFDGRNGVFFRQQRTRIDGKVFTCLKFRTMHRNKDADIRQVTKNDERITALGRFLRKFSLDELPQFFNVLWGDMSIVGPRPHMLRHTEAYRKLVKEFMVRHTVKPGITGLAQVNGYRGEITNNKDIEDRVKFDVKYIENWSINLDLKIMIITLWLILRGKLLAY